MMNKNAITLVILAAASLGLAGCDADENSEFLAGKYSAPTVTECEPLTATTVYAKTVFSASCTVVDKDKRDLSASIYRFTSVPEMTGVVTEVDEVSGLATSSFTIPADAGDQTVAFCVTPMTEMGNNNIGNETCIEGIKIVEHSAPVATVEPLPANIYDSNTVTATYSVTDAAGRDISLSTVQWLDENGSEMGSTTRLTLGLTDVDKQVRFCVLPKSEDIGVNTDGDRRCTDPVTVQSNPNERAPAVTNVAFTSVPVLVEEASVVTGSYTYVDNSGSFNSIESGSIGQWVDENDGSDLQTCSAVNTMAQNCQYTVAAIDVGKALQYCVTPKTDSDVVGVKTCSGSTVVAGIKVSGSMMFLETLTLEMIGYDSNVADPSTAEWFVDPVISTDLTLDAVRAAGKPGSDLLQHTGARFDLAPAQGLKATLAGYNGITGIFTKAGDHSWAAAIAAGDIDGTIDANHYVGKEVKVCFDVDNTNRCLDVSEQESVSDKFQLAAGLQGIAPITEIVMGDGTVYHRPLTVEEATDKQLGALLPDADANTPINGVAWARFNQQINAEELYDPSSTELGAIRACRRLEGASDTDQRHTYPWYMPEISKSGSISVYQDMDDATLNNNFVKPDPTASVLEKALGSKIIPGVPGRLSASTGWPIDTLSLGTYASAKIDGGKNLFYGGQSYKDMNATTWGTWNGKGGYAVPLVACVKLVTY